MILLVVLGASLYYLTAVRCFTKAGKGRNHVILSSFFFIFFGQCLSSFLLLLCKAYTPKLNMLMMRFFPLGPALIFHYCITYLIVLSGIVIH